MEDWKKSIVGNLANNMECCDCPLHIEAHYECAGGNYEQCRNVWKEFLFNKVDDDEEEETEEKEPKTFSDFINTLFDDLNEQVFGFKDPKQPEEREEPIQPKVTFRTNLDGSTELSGSPEAVAEFMRKVGGSIGL